MSLVMPVIIEKRSIDFLHEPWQTIINICQMTLSVGGGGAMRTHYYPFYILVLILSLICTSKALTQEKNRVNPDVRLVLQITIDGLRGDLLNRYADKLSADGFKSLLNNGTVFTNAHYQHANTETIVGHTTLATGAFPSDHGMIGNVWFDSEAKELAYNIEDADYRILPDRKEASGKEEVDPAQKLSRAEGRSPNVILVPTTGDTLSAYSGGKSKIFGVSSKDRSAVSMAGKTGRAFWFSVENGDFVTSTYYYGSFPQWATKWNEQRKAESYAGRTWELLGDVSTYMQGERDDRPYEADLKGFGRVFPHKFGHESNKVLYTQIVASPVGDQLLLDFTKELIKNEGLGEGGAADYLSISFSGVDAVNHFFGPSSLENEDIIRQLDRTLSDLFKFIDKKVGLDHTLIILSADHGMAEMPEYMTELGYTAGRLEPDEIIAIANDVGKQYDIEEVVRFFYRPYIYLDNKKISAENLDSKKLEQAIANALTDTKGIAVAVPSSNLMAEHNNKVLEQVRRNYHASRSGDIYVIQEPYWFLFDEGPIPAMHGSPWRYDTHVPIIFVGPNINSQKVQRLVHPVDVAPTIAEYLGISAPASSQGRVLQEVFQH